ncbi:MAG: hypothetical protein AAFX94_21655 [Myxococcota bacterium]
MAEITRAEFVRALEGFDPYTDYQIEPEDRTGLARPSMRWMWTATVWSPRPRH